MMLALICIKIEFCELLLSEKYLRYTSITTFVVMLSIAEASNHITLRLFAKLTDQGERGELLPTTHPQTPAATVVFSVHRVFDFALVEGC